MVWDFECKTKHNFGWLRLGFVRSTCMWYLPPCNECLPWTITVLVQFWLHGWNSITWMLYHFGSRWHSSHNFVTFKCFYPTSHTIRFDLVSFMLVLRITLSIRLCTFLYAWCCFQEQFYHCEWLWCIFYSRLHGGVFAWPPDTQLGDSPHICLFNASGLQASEHSIWFAAVHPY